VKRAKGMPINPERLISPWEMVKIYRCSWKIQKIIALTPYYTLRKIE
jgi:hypothetical protein